MSTDRDTTRIVRSWLDEGVTQLPDRVLDVVLDQIPATPQRRRGGIGGWFRFHASFALPAAAALAVTLVVGALTLSGEVRVGWGPGESAGASAKPATNPILPEDLDSPLAPGRWTVPASFDVPLTLEVGPGWQSCWHGELELGVCLTNGDAFDTPSVSFSIIESVLADPCDLTAGGSLRGADVEEIAAAISGLSGFEVTEPRPAVIDGVPGLRFSLRAPIESSCPASLRTWATADRVNGVSPGETNDVTILVVDGDALLIAAAYHTPPSAFDRARVSALIDSVQFER